MNFKSFTPHLIAIGLFLLVTAAYFSPVIFGGKQIFQEDIMRYKGVSKEISDFRKQYHEEPYWTNSLFCGMPAYQISALYLSSNLAYMNKLFYLFLPHPTGMIFFAFLGFYFLLQVLRIDPWLSVMGAFAFGLSSYFFVVIDAGHNTKMAAIAYMAPVLAGIILTYRGKLLVGGALTALFLTLELYCNHPQIMYYLAFILVFYAFAELFNAWKAKNITGFAKQSAVIVIAAVIALGVNITSLWATADYSQYTIRGGTELTIDETGKSNADDKTSGLSKKYATTWSYGVSETMTLLIPNFKGGASEHILNNKEAIKDVDQEMRENFSMASISQYFGEQPFTSGPVYAGAIVIFLFVLGLFVVKGPLKWVLVVSTIFSIWLSWGKNDPFGFSNFMLDHFPAYNKFRAVSMMLVIAQLTIPILAILALDALIKNKNFLKEKITLPFKQSFSGQKILIVSFLLTGGIAFLCWLAPGMFTDFSTPNEYNEVMAQIKQKLTEKEEQQRKNSLAQTMPALETVREAIVKADAIRSFFFILLAGILIWLFAKNKINKKILIGSLIVLILFDMVKIDLRYLNNESFVKKPAPSTRGENPVAVLGRPNSADLEIMKDTDPNYRVWNTFSRPDQDVATSYFHKSISGYHGAKLKRYQELIDFHIDKQEFNMEVINMLNTKYVIMPGEKNEPIAYPNREALGNAWFVDEYKIVANPDSEITALSNFNPATTAILDKRFENELRGFKPQKDSLASIKLTSYKANNLIYESNTSSEHLAVFSEIYYPSGWNAYIDGKLTPHFRVNYVLRAMRIPAGKHNVEFKFEPKIISVGEKISAASMVMLTLLCIGASIPYFSRRFRG